MLLIVARRAKTKGLVRESEESRLPSGSANLADGLFQTIQNIITSRPLLAQVFA